MKGIVLVNGCILLLIVLVSSGCFEQTATQQQDDKRTVITENHPPSIDVCKAEYFDTYNSSTVYFFGFAHDDDGTIVSYYWTLSDGSTSTNQSFSHTFQTTDIYHATLTVTDDRRATDTRIIDVMVYASTSET